MSPDIQLMYGLTSVLVPTIIFGCSTVLGVIPHGPAGLHAPKDMFTSQIAF